MCPSLYNFKSEHWSIKIYTLKHPFKKKKLTGWLMYKSECGPVSRTGQSYPANKHTPSKKMNSFYRFALPEGSIGSYRQSELFNQLSQSAQCNVVKCQKQRTASSQTSCISKSYRSLQLLNWWVTMQSSSDNGSVSCDKQWSPRRDDCQARDKIWPDMQ